MTRIRSSAACFAAGAVLSTATASAAQIQVYPASGQRLQAGDSIHVVGTPATPIALMLVANQGAAATDVVLTPFSSESGGTTARFVAPDASSGPATTVDFSASPYRTVTVQFDSLPGPQPFAGALVFSPGSESEHTVTIVVESAAGRREATLVLDVTEVELNVTVPPLARTGWRWFRPTVVRFPITISGEDSAWPIRAFMARVEELDTGSSVGFDPRSSVRFFDGRDSLALWRSALPTENRSLEPDEVRTLEGRAEVTRPGEYGADIRFTSANSVEHDNQVLQLTIRARHPIWTIVMVLVLGVGVSFVLTKVLSVARQQLAYRTGLDNLSTGFLRTEPPTMAVVRALAMVRRAEALATGLLLSWRDLVSGPLEREKKRMLRIQRLGALRRNIDGWPEPEMIKRRARKHLRSIMTDLDAEVDEALLGRVDRAIEDLETWNDDQKRLECYKQSLADDIANLHTAVEPSSVNLAKARTRMEELQRTLRNKLPTNKEDLIDMEKDYARLKILWEWRDDDEELDKLTDTSDGSTSTIDDLFREADTFAWHRLEGLQLVPRGSRQPVSAETFEPILFEVVPRDRRVGDNYLFNHNLTFTWTFTMPPRKWEFWRGKSSARLKLTPTTNEPRVVQYAPVRGKLEAEVTLTYRGDSKVVKGPTVKVIGSSTKRLLHAFSRIEWITSSVALIAAVVSGVLMFYVDNPTFGSAKDYLTVVLWALAVDQSKNFLQIRQTLEERSGGRA